ncbi:Pvc16 family protein [Bacteroides fluxus]|uniref:Pvc16 family protein n=1 Tax=Bacteroides fluxus TaxID=626930 RepID=UPI002354175E|nr:Pvc16 family protein [Bacteroides fluxus]
MIRRILTYYAERLDEYLSRLHHQPEGLAEVGFIGNSADERLCKLIVSLVNIERETSGGISSGISRGGTDYVQTYPLLLSLDLMLAAVYDDRQYAQSLSVLNETLLFAQSHPFFELDGQRYTVELVMLSAQDTNNIWTTLSGQYYPSVMCKLRRLVVDANEASGSGGIAREPSVNILKKEKTDESIYTYSHHTHRTHLLRFVYEPQCDSGADIRYPKADETTGSDVRAHRHERMAMGDAR